jgi:myo-inositol catabolism protein IolC
MALGYDKKLYVLAIDHRRSFKRMLGDGDTDMLLGAKQLIWKGFQRALEEGAPVDAAGILIDGQYGDEIAREARRLNVLFAMPVETSGQDEFDFEHGAAFADKIEQYDPSFSKVLVRFNVEGDTALNDRQVEKLRRLSEWLHNHDRKFLFELLVPATPEQLARLGGHTDRYDEELRPRLMMEAIVALQNGGVEPDVWKIEGIESRDACLEIAHVVRRDGRDRVSCVVLGRGASHHKVDTWLRAGAGLDGYIGFAIGRSIFADVVKAFARDPDGYDRTAGAQEISRAYRRYIDVYERAETNVRATPA